MATPTPLRPVSKPTGMGRGAWAASGVGGAALSLTVASFSVAVEATPLYSIRAANACNTCHIEPIGWYDPPQKKDRACSLDCQACHVNRSGAGLRNAYGSYYANEVLPMFRLEAAASSFAARPSSAAGQKGRYRLGEGFSGWRPGKTPVAEVKDRTGSIPPRPRVSGGLDARLMAHARLGAGGSTAVFPMQLDAHGWANIIGNINAYGTLGLQGRRARTLEDPRVGSMLKQLFTVREAVVEWDGVPYNGYLRLGRFYKPYGWLHPDHTFFVRGPLGLGQYGQVWGIEGAVNPNYPFLRVAGFVQGIADFPGDRAPPGVGVSTTFGFRDLGWQVAASAEFLRLNSGDRQLSGGGQWGVNFYPLVWTGEVDLRIKGPDSKTGVYASNELSYLLTTGVNVIAAYHYLKSDLAVNDTVAQRLVAGARWDALPNIQFSTQYRLNIGSRAKAHEILWWTHVWY